MIPVQEVTFGTRQDRRFLIYIEKPADRSYEIRLYYIDRAVPTTAGHQFPRHNSAAVAYEKMLEFVLEFVRRQNDGDAVVTSNNPCNCELLSKAEQLTIASQLGQIFPIQVNGQD